MSAPPTIALASPDALIQSVPYLLGFTPTSSVVAIAIKDKRVLFCGRLDADAPRQQMWAACTRPDITQVIGVAYMPERDQAQALARDLVDGHPLLQDPVMWVSDTEFGWDDVVLSLPEEVAASTVALVVEGVAPRADRATLVEQFTPLAKEDDLSYQWHRDELPKIGLGELLLRGTGWDSAIAFAQSVQDIPGRDAVWLEMEGYEQASDFQLAAVPLREVSRRVPAAYRVPVLFLTAWAYWRAGAGAEANIALQALQELDADYSAAGLLNIALSDGLNPHAIPRMRKEDST